MIHDGDGVPFGVGTSLEGGIGALSGGICIDFSEMKNILGTVKKVT